MNSAGESWQVRCLTRPGEPVHVERHVQRLAPGLVRLDQEFITCKRCLGVDASGPHWVFATVRLRGGAMTYLHGNRRVMVPRRTFAFYLPPYSIIQWWLDRVRVRTAAVCGLGEPGPGLPAQAVMIPWNGGLPRSRAEVVRAVQAARGKVCIGRELDPPPHVRRIKELLDSSYAHSLPISWIAKHVGCAPATVSRGFKRHYGVTPGQYRHVLRATDAILRLVQGEDVLRVSGNVGYGDLTRFYTQFRKYAHATPARWRPKSKSAKTAADTF